MKKLMFSTTIFLILFAVGCQENSITDPIQDTQIQKNENPLVQRGVIELEGILEVPGQTNLFLEINGQVEYVHELFLVDPIPPAPQHYVSLSLQVNAGLSDPYSERHPDWLISNKSQDIIYVSENGVYQLVKSFPIQDRSDGMVLVCSFLVTTEEIGLSEMWLATPEDTFNKSGESNPFTMPPVEINKSISH